MTTSRIFRRRAKGRQTMRGFTLLELLVVLTILGLLAALAGPQLMGLLGGAKTKAAKLQIERLETVLDLYKLDMGRYPTTEQGLAALLVKPDGGEGWNGPYLKKADGALDPWGQPFKYRSPGRRGEVDLQTLGADQREGGNGEDRDVSNW